MVLNMAELTFSIWNFDFVMKHLVCDDSGTTWSFQKYRNLLI